MIHRLTVVVAIALLVGILPALASIFLSPALAVVFIVALVSAVLSTIDSAILAPAIDLTLFAAVLEDVVLTGDDIDVVERMDEAQTLGLGPAHGQHGEAMLTAQVQLPNGGPRRGRARVHPHRGYGQVAQEAGQVRTLRPGLRPPEHLVPLGPKLGHQNLDLLLGHGKTA